MNEVVTSPLSVPNRAIQILPVNEILKPRKAGVDAGIEGLDIIEEGFTNIGNVLFGKGEEMALLIIVGVFHIEEDGQFKQDARVLDNFFTEDSLFGGVGGSKGVGVMISPAFETCAVSVVDITRSCRIVSGKPKVLTSRVKLPRREVLRVAIFYHFLAFKRRENFFAVQ